MKKIFTLILFIFLIITTTIIPVNTNAFSENANGIFNQTNAEAVSKLSKTIELNQLNNSNDLYTFELVSKQNITDNDLHDLSFKAIGVNENGEKRTLSLGDFNYKIDKSPQRVVYHIIAIKDTNIYGEYQENLAYDVNYGPESLTTAITEEKENSFTFAKGLKGNGKMAKQVSTILSPIYYTNNEENLSFPVYTALLPAKNYYRSVLDTMAHTPNYLNLDEYIRFPHVANVWQNTGNLTLEISPNELKDFNQPQKAKMVLNNLVRSFEDSQRELTVNNIFLAINNSNDPMIFGGIDTTREYPVYHGAKLFLPYVKNEETTWIPQQLQDNADFEKLAKKIIETYKNPKLSGEDIFAQLIPDDVVLESANIEGRTARLYFNDSLIKRYQDNKLATNAFCEGLALTLSSLSYIDNYELYCDSELVTQIGEAIVYSPVGPPTYYNVDEDYILK